MIKVASPPAPQSLVYSTVGELDLHLDVYVPDGAVPGSQLPALVWYHSGGLVNGGARDMYLPGWLRDATLAEGWLFISAEYRLLVPSTGFDLLEDVVAISRFLESADGLGKHLAEQDLGVNVNKIALSGASAGGYMSRLHALNCGVKPAAILSLYGMGGDFLSPHWTEAHPDGVRFNGPFSRREDVAHLLDTPQKPIADAPIISIPTREHLLPSAQPAYNAISSAILSGHYTNDADLRGSLYNFYQCHGLYLDQFTGIESFTAKMRALPWAEREAALPEEVRPLFVQLRASELPPTVLVHGTEDTSVDISDSDRTCEVLLKAGVEVEYIKVVGLEHGLMSLPDKSRGPEAFAAFYRAFDFVKRHM